VAVDVARLDPAGTLSYLTQTIRDSTAATPVDFETAPAPEEAPGGAR
jgi:hypothetical protein